MRLVLATFFLYCCGFGEHNTTPKQESITEPRSCSTSNFRFIFFAHTGYRSVKYSSSTSISAGTRLLAGGTAKASHSVMYTGDFHIGAFNIIILQGIITFIVSNN